MMIQDGVDEIKTMMIIQDGVDEIKTMLIIQDGVDKIKTMMILQDGVDEIKTMLIIQDGVDEIKIHSSDEHRHPETFSSLLLQRGDAQLHACAHQRFQDPFHDDYPIQSSLSIMSFSIIIFI